VALTGSVRSLVLRGQGSQQIKKEEGPITLKFFFTHLLVETLSLAVSESRLIDSPIMPVPAKNTSSRENSCNPSKTWLCRAQSYFIVPLLPFFLSKWISLSPSCLVVR
jgi:hypothetical protein